MNDGTFAEDGTHLIVGASETTAQGGSPATHATLWTCNMLEDACTKWGEWVVTDIKAPPGLQNSRGFGIGIRQEGVYAIVGVSDDGSGTEVATLWQVELSGTPAFVTIHDLNDRTPNLPANLTLGESTATSSEQTGREDTIICQAFSHEITGAAAGVGNPHAVVLTEVLEPGNIPTVSEWGLVAMVPLILTAGTVVLRRLLARTAG